MRGLSDRQRTILEYMHQRHQSDGVQPSYREIGSAMGIKSTNGVSDHVKALLKKGYLSRVGGEGKGALARALTLTPKATEELGVYSTIGQGTVLPAAFGSGDIVEIGVYGQVAAGALSFAEEHREETLRLDACMVPGGGKVFALRVFGESMIDDGILPGDYLFVQKQLEVPNGEIAVVMVDGESTVKRFYHEGNRIRLQPGNAMMRPIYIDLDEFKSIHIIGVVCGVYRRVH
jgi:repressor LexA